MRQPAGNQLTAAAIVGVVLVVLYPDGYQQDAGHHFLFARWAWTYPELLVGVGCRPLFTLLYGSEAASRTGLSLAQPSGENAG